jgi:DMSO/TMAO reductase YedYZ heme-binding membrane subunit
MTEPRKTPSHLAWPIIYWTFILAIGYSVIRYHLMGGVPWKDFPFFILNKAISMSALILLTINFALGPMKNIGMNISPRWLRSRRIVGIMGFMQAFMHIIMSFLLFNPSVYGKFFGPNGTMNWWTGLSMLGGVLAFILIWIYNISFNAAFRKDKDLIAWITSRKVIVTGMLFTGMHLFFIGFKGWMNPAGWHGGLPPISLLSFAFFFVGFVFNLFGREDPE